VAIIGAPWHERRRGVASMAQWRERRRWRSTVVVREVEGQTGRLPAGPIGPKVEGKFVSE
jgi:hypothetical protein